MSGRVLSQSHKDNISKSNKGKHLTEECKKKMSLSRLGTIPWNKGLRKGKDPRMEHTGMPGNKHPGWLGGVSRTNTLIRQSAEYKLWREEVFRRDDWTCRFCGARSSSGKRIRLEAHHIKSFCLFPELRFIVSNGLTLCKKCHDTCKDLVPTDVCEEIESVSLPNID